MAIVSNNGSIYSLPYLEGVIDFLGSVKSIICLFNGQQSIQIESGREKKMVMAMPPIDHDILMSQHSRDMIRQKQNSIRKQMRASQLGKKFALQRKALIDGPITVFRELDQQIRRASDNPSADFEVISALNNCVSLHPNQENIFILIGNYILDHPESVTYFHSSIVEAPYLLQNTLWCLHLIANFYSLKLKDGYPREELVDKLDSILCAADNICNQLQTFHMEEYRKRQMQKYVLIITYRLLEMNYLPTDSEKLIRYTLQIIRYYPKDNFDSQFLSDFFSLFYLLLKNEDFLDRCKLMEEITIGFQKIALDCLKKLPQCRQQCIQILRFLMIRNNTSNFSQNIFSRTLILQLLYLLDQIPYLKPAILSFLGETMHALQTSELIIMLEMRVHVKLTQGLEESIHRQDPSQLQKCLSSINFLLTRLRESNEEKLLQKVLRDIENVDFHLMVEGLANNEQNSTITNLLDHVIDEFYSEQQEL